MCSIIGYLGSSISAQDLRAGFDKTISRGPDDTRMLHIGAATLGFHRLAIMGLHPEGMQPFTRDGSALVCNGEIYGFRPIRERLIAEGETFESESDCEILLPLYEREGLDMFRGLDAEFAMVIYDARRGGLVAARDPIGIRPLYYGYDAEGAIVFASEPKNLVEICDRIMPFPPGHYYKDGKFVCYRDITAVREVCRDDLETVCGTIREKLITGIRKRLVSDAKVGFLLSGGLDSSVALHWAHRNHRVRVALSFDYASKHAERELECAAWQAASLGIEHRVIDISPISAHLKSALLSGADDIPDGSYDEELMKQTVVPFRNGIFLSIAAGVAESCGAQQLVIAAHSGDHSIYPDCREEFMAAMTEAVRLGTYAGLGILRPFIRTSKGGIAAMGHELGVDFSRTYSCYKGGPVHCGACSTCVERREAFREAGIPDPTVYAPAAQRPNTGD